MPNLPHPAHRYNEDLHLKVPLLLWLAMFFLVRHFLILGITFLPTTGEEIKILRELIHPLYLLSDLPAGLVMLVAMRRRPECADRGRRVWRLGRWLLGISAAGYLIFLSLNLFVTGRPLHLALNELLLLSILLHLGILGYLIRSGLLRDLFDDFPEAKR